MIPNESVEGDFSIYITHNLPAYMSDIFSLIDRIEKLERENVILKNKIRRMQR